MKKKLSIVLLILVLAGVALIIGSLGDDPLDPAVKEALAFQPPETAPEDNAYIGVCGLGAVEDGDVVTAGKKYLSDRSQANSDSVKAGDLDFSYQNPCLEPGREACLDQIAAEAPTINEALQKNHEILNRYRTVRKMPRYVNTSSEISDRLPRYGTLIGISKLIAAKALLDMRQGSAAAGLEDIEADLDFYERICQSEQASLIDMMIAIAAIQTHLIGLGKIIEDPRLDLAGHEDRLRKMLALDINAAQMMTAALTLEKQQYLRLLGGLPDGDMGPPDGLSQKLQLFLYKKNMTLNLVAIRMDEEIRRIQAAPLPGFPKYCAQREAEDQERSGPTFKDLYQRYGPFFFKNYTGELLINVAQPLYWKYMARINDAFVRSRLLRAQLELRLMADRPEDVSEALARLGPETWNPYTGRPFEWNKKTNTVWAESAGWAEADRAPGSAKRLIEGRVPAPRP